MCGVRLALSVLSQMGVTDRNLKLADTKQTCGLLSDVACRRVKLEYFCQSKSRTLVRSEVRLLVGTCPIAELAGESC